MYSFCTLFLERTYLCLGQWEEKGVMYTYTMRNDTSTNECFVGLIVNDEEIYIKEAGDHCIRNIDPKTEGMRLYKKGKYLYKIPFIDISSCFYFMILDIFAISHIGKYLE